MGAKCNRVLDAEDQPSIKADLAFKVDEQTNNCNPVASPVVTKPGGLKCGFLHTESTSDEPYSRMSVLAKSFTDSSCSDDLVDFDLDPEHDAVSIVRKAKHFKVTIPFLPDMTCLTFEVTLNVYDVGTSRTTQAINRCLKPIGAGIFHCAVEVFGCEWSFSDTVSGTGCGVFLCAPRICSGHTYDESISMGMTEMCEGEIRELLTLLGNVWRAESYSTLTNNCCHFCNDLTQRLGVGPIPKWVMTLATAGAAIAAVNDTSCCRQAAGECSEQLWCGSIAPAGRPRYLTQL